MIVTKIIKAGPSDTLTFTGPDKSTPVRGLTIYGKSVQNGAPSTSSPVAIESVASGGTLTLTVINNGVTSTFTIPVANGLKGIRYAESPYKYLIGNGAYLATQDGEKLIATVEGD